MKNKKAFLIIFFVVYALGILFGCISEVRFENQEEIYAYLQSGVTNYNIGASESISAILRSNIKPFSLCAIGTFCGQALTAFSAVVLMRGYSAGFAVTAALRVYGFSGILLCGANIISLGFFIPILAFGEKILERKCEKNYDYKRKILGRILFTIIFLGPVFFTDSLIKGGLSALLTDFAAGILSGK